MLPWRMLLTAVVAAGLAAGCVAPPVTPARPSDPVAPVSASTPVSAGASASPAAPAGERALAVGTLPRRDVSVAGILNVLGGVVQVVREALPLPGVDGMKLHKGDQVRTSAGASAVVTLLDGSTVTLEPNTVVQLDGASRSSDGRVVDITQWAGQTWTSASKAFGTSSRFEIRTPAAAATVRGTAFTVAVARDRRATYITTVDGAVETRTGRGSALVRAGERTATRSTTAPVTERAPAPPAALVFSDTGDFAVVDALGRRAGVVRGEVLREIPGAQIARSPQGTRVVLPAIDPEKVQVERAQPGRVHVDLLALRDGQMQEIGEGDLDFQSGGLGSVPSGLAAQVPGDLELDGLYGVEAPTELPTDIPTGASGGPASTPEPSTAPVEETPLTFDTYDEDLPAQTVDADDCTIAGCIVDGEVEVIGCERDCEEIEENTTPESDPFGTADDTTPAPAPERTDRDREDEDKNGEDRNDEDEEVTPPAPEERDPKSAEGDESEMPAETPGTPEMKGPEGTEERADPDAATETKDAEMPVDNSEPERGGTVPVPPPVEGEGKADSGPETSAPPSSGENMQTPPSEEPAPEESASPPDNKGAPAPAEPASGSGESTPEKDAAESPAPAPSSEPEPAPSADAPAPSTEPEPAKESAPETTPTEPSPEEPAPSTEAPTAP